MAGTERCAGGGDNRGHQRAMVSKCKLEETFDKSLPHLQKQGTVMYVQYKIETVPLLFFFTGKKTPQKGPQRGGKKGLSTAKCWG